VIGVAALCTGGSGPRAREATRSTQTRGTRAAAGGTSLADSRRVIAPSVKSPAMPASCEAVANREAVDALETERRRLDADVHADLSDRARALLADPAHRFPDLERAARALAVSSRTLRRHLSDRGTPFQLLRDQLRRAHAIALVEQSTLVLDDIARALGYADRRSFLRAFARWTGETPSSFRRNHPATHALPAHDACTAPPRR
jgi:AraC-like DNA-binding protein